MCTLWLHCVNDKQMNVLMYQLTLLLLLYECGFGCGWKQDKCVHVVRHKFILILILPANGLVDFVISLFALINNSLATTTDCAHFRQLKYEFQCNRLSLIEFVWLFLYILLSSNELVFVNSMSYLISAAIRLETQS